MQTVTRNALDNKTKTKKKSEDDSDNRSTDEKKPKKSIYSVSTPRNCPQKSSTADIYSKRNNSTQNLKTPQKLHGIPHKRSNESPMKDILKPSPSVNQLSARSSKSVHSNDKLSEKNREKSTASSKNKLPINVTVNSPIARRKLNLERELTKNSIRVNKDKNKNIKDVKKNEVVITQRQRTKTRTLEDDEVKVLTADIIDNNAHMINLTKKLSAQPKAFYVNLNDEPKVRFSKTHIYV